MADEETQEPVEAPFGRYPARVDDKGRLKLPVEFQRYFAALPDKRLFVTSLDRRIATIYPIAVWKHNLNVFETYTQDEDAVEQVFFNASDLGSQSEMDGQGRIQISPDLRRALGIENQPVHIKVFRGGIQVMSEKVYQEDKDKFTKEPRAAVKALQRVGLK
jgi:MraZ protein